jgi:von Willebrand factor type A domain
MQRSVYIAGALLLGALLGCGAEDPAKPACAGDDARCGLACSASHPCSAGLYCTDGQLCAKDCDPAHPCASGGTCTSTGQCQASGAAVTGTGTGGAGQRANSGRGAPDAGFHFGDAGLSLPDAARPSVGGNDPSVCASSNVVAGRVIPTVILIIDQSSSMHDSIGSGSRWNVLRDFLLKADGLIQGLQDRVRFGLAMYSALSEPRNGMPAECPIVTSVAPALENFGAIEQVYRDAEPIDDTPTGDAITAVLDGLPPPAPDSVQDPVVLILATDGEPDSCEQPDPNEGQAETIAAVTRAFGMNMHTFVIGVGNEISEQHQQDVANAGLGKMPGEPAAPFWTADDDASLRDALMEIISAQVSCDVKLKGKVEGDACQGTVRLNGKLLECNKPDGWELVDATNVRLVGAACTEFRSSELSMLDVTFPCGVVFVD